VQFVRWTALLRAQGATRITVQCAVPLMRLLQTMPTIDDVVPMDAIAPPHDVHADVMSLPHLLHTGDDMLARLVPYLQVSRDNALLEARLSAAPRNGRLRLGLVWGGTPMHTEDHSRSMPLASLLPVLQRRDVQIVVLQQGPSRAQLDALAPTVRESLLDVADQCTDMADTAQVLTDCDVLLSVDTSVAHVAGAIGVPIWVMVAHPAEWRWGRDRNDSLYYPHCTVLRQQQRGDWSAVVDRVQRSIDAWHQAHR